MFDLWKIVAVVGLVRPKVGARGGHERGGGIRGGPRDPSTVCRLRKGPSCPDGQAKVNDRQVSAPGGIQVINHPLSAVARRQHSL